MESKTWDEWPNEYYPQPKGSMIKCTVVGNQCNGKTCLMYRYEKDEFPGEYIPTVQDNITKWHMIEGKGVTMGIHDTLGINSDGDYYDRQRPLSYPGTDVFLICFGIINRYAFDCIKTHWIPEITYHCPDAKYLIIRTKDDLIHDKDLIWRNMQRINKFLQSYLYYSQIKLPLDIFGVIANYLKIGKEDLTLITNEEGQKLCDEVGGYKYMTCSAYKGTGVNEIFDEVCKCWYETKYGYATQKTIPCGCILL